MSKQLHKFVSAIALSLATLLFNGCSDSSKSTNDKNQNAGKERVYTIGMSQCNLGEPWRVQMNEDIRSAAAKHANLKVMFKDAQNDTLKQRSHIEELLGSQVDLIIISPKEA